MRALGLRDPKCAAFDGPPRMVAMGFQVANGEIASDDTRKPMIADMFDDPAFRQARYEARIYATMLRRMEEFEPARLGPEEIEYTSLKRLLEKLKGRFTKA